MQIKAASNYQALLCALTLPLCAMIIRPYVEMGIVDDWSYIKTAQVLAETHHVVYNGWATAMLGWQLYAGALFIKLFGFSFTAVRASTVLVAMVCAFLMQRTLVRVGVRQWNATIATLTVLLSPPFLAVTFSFMSDIFGLLTLVFSFYACMRAVQSSDERSRLAWICIASLSNVVGGTARQIAWLGALVMVPSTLWLFRRQKKVLLLGGLCSAMSIVSVFGLLGWFNRQPYTLPEPLIPAHLGLSAIGLTIHSIADTVLELSFLALPIFLVFVLTLRPSRRAVISIIGLTIFLLGLEVGLHHIGLHHLLIAPYSYNNLNARGFIFFPSIAGDRPILMHGFSRLALSGITLVGLIGTVTVVSGASSRKSNLEAGTSWLSWRQLGVVVGPCLLAYFGLLLPRGAVTGFILDRYLLFPEFLILLCLLRFYQEKIRLDLPSIALVLVGVGAALDVVGTHDVFQMFRAHLALINEARSNGVPALAIDGGDQYNGWVQIEQTGYIDEPRIRIPAGAYTVPLEDTRFDHCHTEDFVLYPSIKAQYVVSFDPTRCVGLSQFAPVRYHTWFPPHETTIYLVKTRLAVGQ